MNQRTFMSPALLHLFAKHCSLKLSLMWLNTLKKYPYMASVCLTTIQMLLENMFFCFLFPQPSTENDNVERPAVCDLCPAQWWNRSQFFHCRWFPTWFPSPTRDSNNPLHSRACPTDAHRLQYMQEAPIFYDCSQSDNSLSSKQVQVMFWLLSLQWNS